MARHTRRPPHRRRRASKRLHQAPSPLASRRAEAEIHVDIDRGEGQCLKIKLPPNVKPGDTLRVAIDPMDPALPGEEALGALKPAECVEIHGCVDPE